VFESVTADLYLLSDFEDRMHEGVIDPPDMARNRVYPVGAAVGMLLDFFGIDWKARASDAAHSPGLAEILAEGLRADGTRMDSLMVRAQQRYDYDAVLAACERLARTYPLEYQAAVDTLDRQPGFHITVEVQLLGLSRSRSCQGKRWVLEEPSRALSESCHVYTLRHVAKDDLVVNVHDSAIVEETDAQGTRRRVTFLAADIHVAELDGRPLDFGKRRAYSFSRLNLAGRDFSIRYEGKGTLAVDGLHLTAELVPPP